MLKPEIIKADTAQDYDSLKRQFFALTKFCESKMHQCNIYSQKLAEYDKDALLSRNEMLNSEREINAILTQENEDKDKRIAELENHLSSLEFRIEGLKEELDEERNPHRGGIRLLGESDE